MKTRVVSHSFLGLSLVLALASGCTREKTTTSTLFIDSASAEPVMVVSNTPLVALAPTATPPVAELTAGAAAAPETAPPIALTNAVAILPQHLRVSAPLGEVIKLSQAGVDESVLLAFITNSSAAFQLGAEEIVYLNDLGVASPVITAMMHRDQTLKQFWASQAAPPPAAKVAPETTPAPQATAPSYVTPPVAAAPTTYVSEDYFDETLSPYGTWVEVEGYGRCWRPTIVVTSPGWRPYCDRGRWVYTDCGWYWLSDYSWGAVAFHYGRWFEHPRFGWCWWPDRVWGPSWVSWRYSDDYCGWAPLPPSAFYVPGFGFRYHGGSVVVGFEFGLGWGAYTYVPWGYACGPRPYQHRIPHHDVERIHGRARPVNDFATGPNNVAINRGIPPDRVKSYTRTEVRTVSIREQPIRGTRGERLERDGRTLVVARPRLDEQPLGKPGVPTRTERGSVVRSTGPGDSKPGVAPTPLPPNHGNRVESRTERGRAPEAPAPKIGAPSAPRENVVQTAPTPTRVESRPARDRSGAAEIPVSRTVQPAVEANRPAGPAPRAVTTPTPVTRPTPILSNPITVQSSSQPPTRPTAPSSSVVVVGRDGNGGNRTGGGRDYSVWSSPTPATTPSESAPSPRIQAAPVAPQSPTVVTPRPSETPAASSPSWTPSSRGTEERSRSFTPAPAPVSRPSPAVSAPVIRPVPVAPSPSPAPRVSGGESRSAPAPAPAPAPSRSESRSDSRPASNPSGAPSRSGR